MSVRLGVALALALGLLLSMPGCRPPTCPSDRPDRPADAPAAAAEDLLARIAGALGEPRATALALEEGELTALLRQALQNSLIHDITVHVTEEALHLGASAGRHRVPIRMALLPTTAEGRLSVRVLCLTAKDTPLPRLARAGIESALDALAADAAWSWVIESVTLREGSLLLVIGHR